MTKIDHDMVDQLRALGAPLEVIEAAAAPAEPVQTDIHVWEDNWPAVAMFVGLKTQWRMHFGMAGVHYQGLDYGAVEVALRLANIPRRDRPAMLDDLRTMEQAALPLLNEKD